MTEVHTYYLSTAENELGVVIAYSESGICRLKLWFYTYAASLYEGYLESYLRLF
jgi:exosome complex RNA-binding protein Csl4